MWKGNRQLHATIGLYNQNMSAQMIKKLKLGTFIEYSLSSRGHDLTVVARCPPLMPSGSLEGSLHGWILVYTVLYWWKTAWCGRVFCKHQHCENRGSEVMIWAGIRHRQWSQLHLIDGNEDYATRSLGSLPCHSPLTIAMLKHDSAQPLHGYVHNSWKLKSSYFLHGLHTH